ncbi:mechanosensitive ion channel family protein [Pelagibius sp. Alg239-R121]|uniref:mechanosensitive ion channel family protein n=1 Tax=Pelagibius sp. Alg239-R121 TaxID=2993448 RepID=UPI0024A7789B|nr:mechanosensitive ion channel family protein [Pelagibius sp. Alg239-R121]
MQELTNFWNTVTEVWTQGYLGIDIGRIVTAIGIIAVAMLLRGLFTRIVIRRLRAMVERSETSIDDEALDALEGPLRLVPVVIGLFFALEYLKLDGLAQTVGVNFERSLVAFVIFWGLYRLVDPLSFLLHRLDRIFTAIMVEWLVKAIKGAFLFLGAATILEVWGIQVGPIIAGLGLFGVAVALGAQDMFKNMISGILIIAEKRFERNDWIKVDGVVEGTVESIGFRSTRIRRFDKAPVHVPNSFLSDNAVTNFSKMTNRRIYWMIGVEYHTTAEQLRQIVQEISDYLKETPDFETDPRRATTLINVDSFNDSSIDIMLYCFTKTTNWGDWMVIKENLALKVKEIVEGAGSGFAFPTTTIHIEGFPGKDSTPEGLGIEGIRAEPGSAPEAP